MRFTLKEQLAVVGCLFGAMLLASTMSPSGTSDADREAANAVLAASSIVGAFIGVVIVLRNRKR